MLDRYGEPIDHFDPSAGEVFMESGEILDALSAEAYADARVTVYHGNGLATRYRQNGQVEQIREDGEVFMMPDVGAVIERVIDLWNSEGGWIPGAHRHRLADALGVPRDRLRTAQQLREEN